MSTTEPGPPSSTFAREGLPGNGVPMEVARPGAWWWLIASAIIAFVHGPALNYPFAADDLDHIANLSGARAKGQLPEWILERHNEHWVPLWKLGYAILAETARGWMPPWRVTLSLIHLGTAAGLFALLVRLGAGRRGASIGSLLWAGAALGGPDSPHWWTAASHLSLGVMFWLFSMVATLNLGGRRPFLQAGLGGLWALLTVLSMSPLVVLLPAPALLVWLDRRRHPSAGVTGLALAGTALAVGVAVSAHALLPSEHLEATERRPLVTLVSTPLVLIVSAGQLVCARLAPGVPQPVSGITLAGLIGIIGLLALTRLIAVRSLGGSIARRTLLLTTVIGVTLLGYLTLTCWSRTGWPVLQIADWGRYRYAPTLLLCLLIGVTAGDGRTSASAPQLKDEPDQAPDGAAGGEPMETAPSARSASGTAGSATAAPTRAAMASSRRSGRVLLAVGFAIWLYGQRLGVVEMMRHAVAPSSVPAPSPWRP
jgi:hypothetical protein